MSLKNPSLLPELMTSISGNEEITIGQLMLILSQEHTEEEVMDLTRKYCLHSSSEEVQKKGMEFLYINGFYEDLRLLVFKNLQSQNPSNRKWAEVYQVVMDRRDRSYSAAQMRTHLRDMETNDPELRCLIELLIVDTYFNQLDFGKIGNLLDKQQELFDPIQDNFMLSCFNLRLYQKLFLYYWKRNELIMARKYAFRALNQTNNPETKVSLHIHLGLSYTFDTYYQGMYHLKEGLKIAKKYNLDSMVSKIENSNIPFLAAHFKRPGNIVTDDIGEEAHLEIARGNSEKAIELLEKTGLTSPFKMYYMGLAKKDKNLLSASCQMFVERSDYFFSRLAINALRSL